jgi:hypothetical protein
MLPVWILAEVGARPALALGGGQDIGVSFALDG